MKLIKHFNDYWVSYVIILLIAFLLFLMFRGNTNYPSWKIQSLEQENMSISIMNNEILRTNDSLKQELFKTKDQIDFLKKRDSSLKVKSDSLSLKLNHIKLQYENVINRVEHFNNDSIRQYFSELEN